MPHDQVRHRPSALADAREQAEAQGFQVLVWQIDGETYVTTQMKRSVIVTIGAAAVICLLIYGSYVPYKECGPVLAAHDRCNNSPSISVTNLRHRIINLLANGDAVVLNTTFDIKAKCFSAASDIVLQSDFTGAYFRGDGVKGADETVCLGLSEHRGHQ